MSRSKRFISGLLSSYAALGINILYTIGSIPLALHYLNKEQFGLWALVAQMSAYLGLLELGMRGSVSRILSDHKDQIEGGSYGCVLKTGNRIFFIQGLAVTFFGLVLSMIGPQLLDLPTTLHERFSILMALQSSLGGVGLAMAGIASPLWCHQRLDISALTSSLCMILSFIFLWAGFALGLHIYSLLAASFASLLVGTSMTYICCKRLGFYPSRENRGKYDPVIFRELFHFGSGLFLMNLGTLMASASQVVLVSRLMGVESAAIWSVSTKLFNMAQQFVSKILDSSAGGLTEMLVRGDHIGLRDRFRDLMNISAVVAVGAAGAIALMNGAFIEVWTSGKITWGPLNNLLLGCVLFSTAVTRCHIGLVGITKQIRGMKYINLLEGLAFILLSLILVPSIGMAGLLVGTMICNAGIVGFYGVSRTASYFETLKKDVLVWVAKPTAVLVIVISIFFLGQWFGFESLKVQIKLLVSAVVFAIVIPPCLWIFGLDDKIRCEIMTSSKLILNQVRQRRRSV